MPARGTPRVLGRAVRGQTKKGRKGKKQEGGRGGKRKEKKKRGKQRLRAAEPSCRTSPGRGGGSAGQAPAAPFENTACAAALRLPGPARLPPENKPNPNQTKNNNSSEAEGAGAAGQARPALSPALTPTLPGGRRPSPGQGAQRIPLPPPLLSGAGGWKGKRRREASRELIFFFSLFYFILFYHHPTTPPPAGMKNLFRHKTHPVAGSVWCP